MDDMGLYVHVHGLFTLPRRLNRFFKTFASSCLTRDGVVIEGGLETIIFDIGPPAPEANSLSLAR